MSDDEIVNKEIIMYKAVTDFLFGLFFGMGFAVASAVLAFIVQILSKGIH